MHGSFAIHVRYTDLRTSDFMDDVMFCIVGRMEGALFPQLV